HAMDLLLTGRLIDAAEAARVGLINRVVAAEELMPWALATAEQIAANSPSAVQAVKRQITSTIAEHAPAPEAMEQTLRDQVRAAARARARRRRGGAAARRAARPVGANRRRRPTGPSGHRIRLCAPVPWRLAGRVPPPPIPVGSSPRGAGPPGRSMTSRDTFRE